MKKEDLFNLTNGIQVAEEMELELFKKKVQELREYQSESYLKVKRMREEMFPQEILNIIKSLSDVSCFLGEIDKKKVYFNSFSKTLDTFGLEFKWTNNEGYGFSNKYFLDKSNDEVWKKNISDYYAENSKRYKLLEIKRDMDYELELWNLVQNHIEVIYQTIADQTIKERQAREHDNQYVLNELSRQETEKKRRTVTISIEIEE